MSTITTIQALRAFAALSVVTHHFQSNYNLVSFGNYGVDVFFVISGFIMMNIASNDKSSFMLKRLARIVPLYWSLTFCVFIGALFFPFLFDTTRPDVVDLVKSLFFIPYAKQNGAWEPILFLGWTLNYEMFFYFVIQLSLLLSPRHVFTTTIVFLLIVPVLYLIIPLPEILHFYARAIIFEFVLGMICYKIFVSNWFRLGYGPSVVLAFFIMLALPILELSAIKVDRLFLFGIPAFVLLLSCLQIERYRQAPFFLVLLGDASYSLYLSHPFIVNIFEKFIISGEGASEAQLVLAFILSVSACIVAAVLSYKLFERPAKVLMYQWFALNRAERSLPAMEKPS